MSNFQGFEDADTGAKTGDSSMLKNRSFITDRGHAQSTSKEQKAKGEIQKAENTKKPPESKNSEGLTNRGDKQGYKRRETGVRKHKNKLQNRTQDARTTTKEPEHRDQPKTMKQ